MNKTIQSNKQDISSRIDFYQHSLTNWITKHPEYSFTLRLSKQEELYNLEINATKKS